MPFPESVKLEAKKRSDFACILCGDLFVDVHHIIPQSEGGPDTLDNAAPLCRTCHRRDGGNPDLRAEIRRIRNHKWEIIKERRKNPVTLEIFGKLDQLARDHREGREQNAILFSEVKRQMADLARVFEHEVDSATTTPQIVKTLSAFATGTSTASASMEVIHRCPECGEEYTRIGSRVCDKCGHIDDDSAFV